MAWKLMDLQNFAVYFDDELLGNLEGAKLVVSVCKLLLQVGVVSVCVCVSVLWCVAGDL